MTYGNTVKDGSGNPWWLVVNSQGHLVMDDGWTPSLQVSEAADDSDKSFTVPASTVWEIVNIWIEYTSSADVGNRLLMVELMDDAADVIGRFTAGIVQAASLTRYYTFAPGVPDLTAFRNTSYLSNPMPIIRLPASYVIRICDSAAIAAAADDMIVQMLVNVKSV